jgi:hypothetical protein
MASVVMGKGWRKSGLADARQLCLAGSTSTACVQAAGYLCAREQQTKSATHGCFCIQHGCCPLLISVSSLLLCSYAAPASWPQWERT